MSEPYRSNLHRAPEFDASSRPNEQMARIVDAGVAYLSTHGRDFAAAYLQRQGISFNVATRVLNEPQQRRIVKKPSFADPATMPVRQPR
jgi:hypothetical protein